MDITVLTTLQKYSHNGQYYATMRRIIRNYVYLYYVVHMVPSDVSDRPPL